jgi:hypothetical protein
VLASAASTARTTACPPWQCHSDHLLARHGARAGKGHQHQRLIEQVIAWMRDGAIRADALCAGATFPDHSTNKAIDFRCLSVH